MSAWLARDHNPMHKLLDRIRIVDADSGALLAQYDNIDGTWAGSLIMFEVYASDQSLLRVGLERANVDHEDDRAGITELLAAIAKVMPARSPPRRPELVTPTLRARGPAHVQGYRGRVIVLP